MHLTPLLPADLDETLALVNGLHPTLRMSRDWLYARTLGHFACPPEFMLLAREGDRVVGCCLAHEVEGRGIVKLFGVAEAYRRRGIATALFDALEARMRERGLGEVAVEAAAPGYFLPGVDLRYTAALSFLFQRGYQSDRVSRVDMAVDLAHATLETADAEARLAAAGITLRRARPEEVEGVAHWVLEVFGRGWQIETADARIFSPTPLFIALEGEKLIGFAVYDVTGPARFGPTGTLPEYRGRGIGSALLHLCLRSLQERGEAQATIGWAGPIAYYARTVGAEISRVYWSFKKPLA